MAIFIDPPVWPAHGTRWSHLVSDHDYDELHEFAAELRLPRRAFDVDHYDVRAADYERAIALGARPVSAKELVRALIASGLRQPKAGRTESELAHRLDFLRTEWRALGERLERPEAPWVALGDELLERWTEPHRRYHDTRHLEDVLLALDQLRLLDGGGATPVTTLLAAWFHDAVYDGAPGDDERASLRLAVERLEEARLPRRLAAEVGEFVLATTPGEAPTQAPDALARLLDADLAILGAGEKRYRAYTAAVRAEYAHVAEADFRAGRTRILEGFLALPRLYRTDAGRRLWEARARRNLRAEIDALTAS